MISNLFALSSSSAISEISSRERTCEGSEGLCDGGQRVEVWRVAYSYYILVWRVLVPLVRDCART